MTYNFSDRGVLRLNSSSGNGQPSSCYPLPSDREIVIGRDPSCQIVLDSNQYPSVSRRHASIRPLDPDSANSREWVVYDLNSSHGTFINGQRLQGGQVLRNGDRITLSPNDPEFIFEYQPLNASTPSPNWEKPDQVVRIKNFWVERTPTQLIFHLQKPSSRRSSKPSGCLWYLIITLLIICSLLLFPIGLIFALAVMFWVRQVAYTFDVSKRQLTIASQTVVDRLCNRYRRVEYSLNNVTGVRLVRSEYEEEEGRKFDRYTVSLERAADEPINLFISLLDHRSLLQERETAQQMVDMIYEYLSLLEEEG